MLCKKIIILSYACNVARESNNFSDTRTFTIVTNLNLFQDFSETHIIGKTCHGKNAQKKHVANDDFCSLGNSFGKGNPYFKKFRISFFEKQRKQISLLSVSWIWGELYAF